jgi:benzoate/toluate 1,2-dioxygenase reductase component
MVCMMKTNLELFQGIVLHQRWLTGDVFEISFGRPAGFTFIPGQKVALAIHDISRQYTLINPPDAAELTICVRHVATGSFTPLLVQAKAGETFALSAASGFFTYQSIKRKAVFVATGTGIAPFLAFIRDGARDFYCLHGAFNESGLLYRDEVEEAADVYVPCLSVSESDGRFWSGRVTTYLEQRLAQDSYDFYLCGNGNMVRDAIQIIDLKFPGSRVFMETFF